MTERTLTPQERVDEWVGLYAQFRKTTPSAPDWYSAIDYMVGALIHDHIEALKEKCNDGEAVSK